MDEQTSAPEQPGAFDFSSLDITKLSDSGTDMFLLHPRTGTNFKNRDGRPVTIKLLGRYSDAFQAEMRLITQRRAIKAGRGEKATPEDMARDEAEQVTAATVGWTIDEMDGQPFPYSRDNAKKLWSDPRFKWVRDRAIDFILQDGNFLET